MNAIANMARLTKAGAVLAWSGARVLPDDASLPGPLALFAYAAPFSFAYLRIGAAVGALVLFGVVQLTMIGYGIVRGDRPSVLTWLGVVIATAGLAILAAPSAARPDPLGVFLMAIAGVAWGVYSLAGRTARDALASTGNASHSEIVVYPDAQHGFHADYRASYNELDARDGWGRMLAWFQSSGVAP